MDINIYMNKHIKYLRYLLKHKWHVGKYCFQYGLYWQGIIHDFSKFFPSEWTGYVEYFFGERGLYGDRSEKTERDFEYAWNHHQKYNPHHWEYWLLGDYSGTSQKALEMPVKYAKEMIADWKGASVAKLGHANILSWYNNRKHLIELHSNTRKFVEKELGLC
jgi:hypothetical protein